MSSGNNSGSQNGSLGSGNLSGSPTPTAIPGQDCIPPPPPTTTAIPGQDCIPPPPPTPTATQGQDCIPPPSAANFGRSSRPRNVNEILKDTLRTMKRSIDTLLALLEFNEREIAARNCCQPPPPCPAFVSPWPCSVPLASLPHPPVYAQPPSMQQQQQIGSQQQQQQQQQQQDEQSGSQQVPSAVSEHREDCNERYVEDRGQPAELASRIVSQSSFGSELNSTHEEEEEEVIDGDNLEMTQGSYETVDQFSASITDTDTDVSSNSGSGERAQNAQTVQAVHPGQMRRCKTQSGAGQGQGQGQEKEQIVFARVEGRLNPDPRPAEGSSSTASGPGAGSSGPGVARRCITVDVDRYDRMDQMFSDTEDFLLAAHDKIESSYVRVCQLGDMYREEMSNIRDCNCPI